MGDAGLRCKFLSYFIFVVPEDKPEDTCCRCPKCYPTGFFAELKNIARLVWPMVILCEISIFTIIFFHTSHHLHNFQDSVSFSLISDPFHFLL